MSQEFHEPEENEIAGPVVLALVIVAIIVISISLM
jgi:hypothetical protein